jgi:glycosyltransferase involved in cell wall biosynthesis
VKPKTLSQRPRIVLDARPLSHPQVGGYRSYVRSLVHGLQNVESVRQREIELLLYFDRPLAPDAENALRPWAEIRYLHPDRLKTDLRLFAKQVRQDAPDLVHGTVNYVPAAAGVPTTFTFHDTLGVKKYPWSAKIVRSRRERLMSLYWAMQTRSSVRRARQIVTISRGSANEIQSLFKIPMERIRIVPNGILLPRPQYSGPRESNTLLAIASPDERKNLAVLYRSLALLQTLPADKIPTLHVVCTNERSAERAEAQIQANNFRNYRLLKSLNDQQLSDAYAAATLFIWPSLYEGFGLPPLEAMQAGCPVLSSSAPVMPEILGEAAAYFDPNDPEELAKQIVAILADPTERQQRSEQGKIHAARFTCENMAEGTFQAWRKVLGLHPSHSDALSSANAPI